jgi:SAM-dependent methyltransferase
MRSRVKLDYDAMAREYAQHRQVDPEVLKNLISMSGLYSGSQVLDAGCGTGNYIVALQNGIGCSCWGIDPSEQMLVKAQERTNTAHLRLGRAEQLDYPDDSFDLVFSVDVIHHIRDRQAYFYKGYRVLRESGRICTVTDSEEIIRQRQPISVYFPDTVDLELQRYPRISDLREMMRVAGFTELQETTVELAYAIDTIQMYRDRAFSCLHMISAGSFERGLQRMEEDLRSGPIVGVSRYLLLWGRREGGKVG